MAIPRDVRYDAMLCEPAPDGNSYQEMIPLLLAEGDSLNFSRQAVSPFAGQMAQGTVEDKDLSRWSVRSQRNWQAGRGQEYSYDLNDERFHDAYADTRFRNAVVLPPRANATSIASVTNPQFLPSQGGVSVTTKQASAQWTKGARVDSDVSSTSAQWATQPGRSDAQSDATASWAARTLGYGNTTYTAVQISGSGRTRVAMSFVTGNNANTLNSITFRIGTSNTAGQLHAAIQADSGGAPSGVDLGSFSVFTGYPPFPTDQSPIDWVASFGGLALSANTTYWIVLRVTSGSPTVSLYGHSSSLTGTCKEYLGSWGSATGYNFYASLSLGSVNRDKSQLRLSQRVLAVATVSTTQVKLYCGVGVWTGSPSWKVRFCNDSGGAIGSVQQEATLGNVGGWQWLTVTFGGNINLTAGSYYWIVIEPDAPTSSDSILISWLRDANGNYPSGVGYSQTLTNGGAWGGYSAVGGNFFFEVGSGYAGQFPFYNGNAITRYRNAQSFTGNGQAFTEVRLLLRRVTWTGSSSLTLSIHADGGGAPAASALRTVSLADPGVNMVWVLASFASLTLTNGVTYWLVLASDAPTGSDAVLVRWQKDSAQGYASGSGNYQFVGNYNAWSGLISESGDFYFYFGTLGGTYLGFYTHDLVRSQLAQSVTLTGSVTLSRLRVYMRQVSRAGVATTTLRVFSDSASAPNAEVASVALPAALFSTTQLAWVDVSISASLAAATYWIFFDVDAPAVGDSVVVEVGVAAHNTGGGQTKARTITNYAAGAWSADQGADAFYIFNGGVAAPAAVDVQPVRFKGSWYMASDNAVYQYGGALNANVGLENTLVPDWSLQASNATGAFSQADVYSGRYAYRITRAGAGYGYLQSVAYTGFTAGNRFRVSAWIRIVSGSVASAPYVALHQNTGAGAYIGEIGRANADVSLIGWQKVEFSGALSGSGAQVFAQVVAVTTDQVILIDEVRIVRDEWVGRDTGLGGKVTALAAFGGKIYAALGDGSIMRESSDGATWANATGNPQYTFLRSYNGYLYSLKAVGGTATLAYFNGSAWATVDAADAGVTWTGLFGWQNEVFLTAESGLFSLSSKFVYQVLDWSIEADAANGRNALVWVGSGVPHIPIRGSLQAFDGARITSMGLDLEEGLPVGEQGSVSAMVGTRTWLFAAVDAGASGRSAVYAYNGKGWHCLLKASAAGRRIRALGLETVTSPSANARLWFWEDATPYYVEMPAQTDNPYGLVGYSYQDTGFVTGSRWGGELAQVVKDLQSVVIRSSDCSAGQYLDVYLDVDGAGLWWYAGRVTQSPYAELVLQKPSFAPKTLGGGCTTTTLNLQSGTTSDMQPGHFVRIGARVVQVMSIASATQFVISPALPAAPAAGVVAYPSRPAGRDVRYRVVLGTNDAGKSPRLLRVSLRWQALVIDKFRFNLGVRAADGMKDRKGGAFPYSAAELAAYIDDYIKRATPFTLVDPRGNNWTVKIMQASEQGYTRTEEQPGRDRAVGTTISLVCDEV